MFFPLSTVASKAPLSREPLCGRCQLDQKCLTPRMKPAGRGARKILIVGEAPGCVSGDTLIDVAFRNKVEYPIGIPIKDLVGQKGFYVYSFDVGGQKLALGKVRKVWSTGVKKTYRVTYEWYYAEGRKRIKMTDSLVVTANHPFLLKKPRAKDPFKGINERQEYLSIEQGLRPGHSLQMFSRVRALGYDLISAFSDQRVREGRFLLGFKIGRELVKGEDCHHRDENKVNESWRNLELLTTGEHAKRHMVERGNPMNGQAARDSHVKAMQSEEYRGKMSAALKSHLSDPENYAKRVASIRKQSKRTSETVKGLFNDPEYYFKYLMGRKKSGKLKVSDDWVERKFAERFPGVLLPEDNHKVVSIEEVGREEVFDMEVEEYHNFAAHGVFVHNSMEDAEGRPFVGQSGQLLRRLLRKNGVNMQEDCRIVNALSCHPDKNWIPREEMIDWCRPLVAREMERSDPEVIILLGKRAVRSVIGRLWKEDTGGITKWAGWKIPCRTPNAWIVPTIHPAHVLRMRDAEGRYTDGGLAERFLEDHLGEAVALAGSRPWEVIPDESKDVETVFDDEQASRRILDFVKKSPVAFDYETTCLKPDGEHARIVCCSLSDGERTIAYFWHGKAAEATRKFLTSPTPKVAQNLKFEDRWSRAVAGVEVQNWYWDTMVQAHVLDMRRGITGLKTQAFIHLGAADYDSHLKPYLDSGKGQNEPNRIHEADPTQVLTYCGIDSLLELRLARIQTKALGVRWPT